jgi:hypothetical protein
MQSQETIEFDCPGKGTKAEPYLITPETHPPKIFRIYELKKHVLIKDVKIGGLMLVKCENFSLIGSEFGAIGLLRSRNCLVEDCQLTNAIEIFKSINIIVQNCKIGTLKLNKAHNNKITNNEIQTLIIKKSSGNVLKSNEVSE